MRKNWPAVKLGEVVTLADRAEAPVVGTTYRQIGVKLWGEGAYEREAMDGAQTKYSRLFRAEAGDIIVNKIWARNGSVAVVPSSLAGSYASGEFPMFTPRPERLDSRWVHWLTKTRDFWAQCDERSQGTSGKNRIKPEQFLRVEIPLPLIQEQQRVLERIETSAAHIKEARTLREQATQEATALATAQLRAIFESLSGAHGITRLEGLITEAGYGSSEKCSPDRDGGAVPVLRIPNVASERIQLDNLKFAKLQAKENERLLLRKGDVLVVRTNGSLDLVGRSAVVDDLPEPMAFASYMIRLRFDQRTILSAYVQRMLQHLRMSGQLIDFARTTAGQYNVSLGRLRSAGIPVPPLPEQRRILSKLDTLQTEIDALKRMQAETATELDALMPSILDKAFCGEM